jgi:hypothetical protein
MNRTRSCPNLRNITSRNDSVRIIVKPVPIVDNKRYSEICHCKFTKNDTKQSGSIFIKLITGAIKPNIIDLKLSESSLLSLHKTYIDKCHVLKIPKVFTYMPKLNKVALYQNRKFIPYSLNTRDNRYWQDHLFCLSRSTANSCQYLKDVGYDIDVVTQVHQILARSFLKNYSIIWLDGAALSDIKIFHIIYILRFMYHHTNPIIIMVPDVNIFKQKYESNEFNVTETISPGFYEFEFMKYIEFNNLIKEVIFDSSKPSITNRELIVSNNVTKVEIAKFLNNYFYVGCNIIKSKHSSKPKTKIKVPRDEINCEVDDLQNPTINNNKTTIL